VRNVLQKVTARIVRLTFEVERKVFFSLCPAGTADFDRLLCKFFELHNFELLHHLKAT
jgi:hypothetical protein